MRLLTCFALSLVLSPLANAADRKGSASLLIPISGSQGGAFGTFWRTDLNLINHRDVPQKVAISFNDADLFTYGPDYGAVVVLPPNSTTTYIDVVGSLLNAHDTGVIYINSVLVDNLSFDPDADLDATYRIWTKQPGGTGTSSQSSAAIDMQTLPSTGEARTIIGVRQDADFRCSVGVASMRYGPPRSFKVTASSPSGSVSMTMTVPGYSVSQMPLPAANLGYMTIVVEPTDGDSDPWTAFASSVDNQSGDSWLVNAMPK